MKAKEINPKVSIGLPVYNGEKTIEKAIKSLLAQTFKDFELIISDNASDDQTQNICQRLALLDERIYYVRQSKNIGIYKNFNFLISIAKGKYFMWAADDDWRSPEFLEANVFALDSNLKFVASTSPNCFEGEENNSDNYIDFNLEGTLEERFSKFLQNAWYSHGIFYSLMRTKSVKKNIVLNFSYAGTDWSFIFFLLSEGEINRTKKGLTILGVHGVSMGKNPWKVFRNKLVEFFIPLYEFSKYALDLMKNLKYHEWVYVFIKLLKVNFQAMRDSYPRTIKDFLGKICK
jgi:glycosyltransferase involved in cell wall biosynthesis